MRKFEYPYKKIMNEGKERYLVKLPDGSSWIEVSPDVFHTLCTSSWKDDKKTQRYHKKIVPFEYDSSDNSHIVQSENRFLALQCKSAEDTFIENELRQEFWRILRENCTDSELQMIHALFFENVTEQAYADRLDIPRSTLHSQKISLFKRLKKIFKNF